MYEDVGHVHGCMDGYLQVVCTGKYISQRAVFNFYTMKCGRDETE